MSSSFHIEFHELYWNIFTSSTSRSTDPDLNVISCGGGKCYIEPWWWVEGATGASGTTPLFIPQGVTIWPEDATPTSVSSYTCLTEVVLAHKWRNTTCSSAPNNTGTCWRRVLCLFIKTSSKGPDVLVGRTMRYTNSINIEALINRPELLWKASVSPTW